MDREQQVGFPWLLVIQIVLAIISYLIQKTPTLADRRHLTGLRDQLQAGFPEIKEYGKED